MSVAVRGVLTVGGRDPRRILALDIGTATGWATRTADGAIVSGVERIKPGRFEGGGMRYLRFRRWLAEVHGGDLQQGRAMGLGAIFFEEVR